MARSRGAKPAGIGVSRAFDCSRGAHGRALTIRDVLLAGGGALLGLWILGLGVAPARGTVLGDNGKIFCEGTRLLNGELPPPAGSPISNTEVFAVNPDGTGETVLTDNDVRDGDPSVAPDGKSIAFESRRDGVSEVYRMASDGTGATRLTTTTGTGFENRATNWSPDGTEIVFQSSRDPLPPGSPAGSNRLEIYTMNADGSNLTRLTNNVTRDTLPAWSPDGTRIAFSSTRDEAFPGFEIYTMKPDGSDVVRLTNSAGEDAQPSWSPDGKQIVFHSRRTGTIDIYRMNADGSGTPTRLTNSTVAESSPVWSPDGKRIAFNGVDVADSSKNSVYTIDAVDGNDLTRVTASPGADVACDWETVPRSPTPTPTPTPTPVPTPTPTSTPTPTLVPDTTPPIVTLSGVPSSMSLRAFGKGVRVKVIRNELSSIDARLDGRAKKATLAAKFNLLLASRAVSRGSGTTTITLKPSKKLVGRAKKLRARVRVVVTDVAGNRRTVTKSIKVTRR